MKIPQFKQGDTFLVTCQYLENGLAAPLPATVRAQVRGDSDVLVEELTVNIIDAPTGKFSMTATTASWPLGMVYLDVMYTYSNGVISRTPTVNILMVEAVTHD